MKFTHNPSLRFTAALATMSVLSLGLMTEAAFGHIPPVVGALTQEFVDLAAILYALRALTGGRREAQPQSSSPTADLSRSTRVAESVT